MAAVWSEEGQAQGAWLEVELAALEAWGAVGAIPNEGGGDPRGRPAPSPDVLRGSSSRETEP